MSKTTYGGQDDGQELGVFVLEDFDKFFVFGLTIAAIVYKYMHTY